MPNAVKYSTTGDTLSLKKGNLFFGVGDVGKGPSSATTYYNGVTPPAGGYTIYSYNVAQTSKLSFHTAVNDSALITYTNGVSGQNFSTATQCLNWYTTQTNYVCVNRDYEGIVTNGLVLNVDAGFTPSYTSSGTTWYDLSYGGYNGTLTNGPTFNSSDGGSVVFDGVDDYIGGTGLDNASSALGGSSAITVNMWVKRSVVSSGTTRTFFGFANSAGVHKLLLNFNTTNLITVFGRSANESGSSVITTTAFSSTTSWYNVTGVWNYAANTIQCYVNGSLQTTTGTVSFSQSTLAAGTFSTRNRIGAEVASATLFPGSIANTFIYNRALSSSEVLQNYNAQVSRFSASYDSDAQAFFTAAGITDTTQKNAVNQLVLDLKSYGIWSSMIAIYPFVGGTATTNKYNLKNPNTFQITFGGGWTHSSTGSLPNGTNGYADTGINWSNIGTTYNYSVYSRTNSDNVFNILGAYSIGGYICGESGYQTSLQFNPRSGNQLSIRDLSNGGASITIAGQTSSAGYYVVNRTTVPTVYKNGSNIGTGSGSSTSATPYINLSLSATNFYDEDCGFGYYEQFDNRELAFATFANASLTSTNVSNLNTAVQAFQTTLGRNV